MPLDAASGVYYEVQGQGQPLLIGLPMMASFTSRGTAGATGAT